MVRRPLWIDLETEQIVQVPHLLFQDCLAGLDAPVGCLQCLQPHDRLGRHFGAFVFAQGEAVVALKGGANFVLR
jgi:hypothetical protein